MARVALSRDGRKLAYSKGRPVANVWRVPILADREAGWEDAEQLTFDEAFVANLELHPDGKQLIISSDRGGSEDLWMAPLIGTDMGQLTAVRGPDSAAAGLAGRAPHRVSLLSRREPRYLGDAGRGRAARPADPRSRFRVVSVVVSRWNGSRLLCGPRWQRERVRRPGRTAADGRQLTMGPVSKYFPQWLDRQSIFFASDRSRSQTAPLPRVHGGRRTEEVTRNSRRTYFRLSPDRTRIYFSGDSRGSNDLWMLTLCRRPRAAADAILRATTEQLGDTGARRLGNTHLYFTLRKDVGDIWVMDVLSDGEPYSIRSRAASAAATAFRTLRGSSALARGRVGVEGQPPHELGRQRREQHAVAVVARGVDQAGHGPRPADRAAGRPDPSAAVPLAHPRGRPASTPAPAPSPSRAGPSCLLGGRLVETRRLRPWPQPARGHRATARDSRSRPKSAAAAALALRANCSSWPRIGFTGTGSAPSTRTRDDQLPAAITATSASHDCAAARTANAATWHWATSRAPRLDDQRRALTLRRPPPPPRSATTRRRSRASG